jgi:hypothetical protein
MQQPFPALTHLCLHPEDVTAPIIPNSFLSGSAPRLRTIYLDYRNCYCLQLTSSFSLLREFSHLRCISPEAMAIGLSSLIRLEKLRLQFRSPRSRPDQERRTPPPPIRSQLPVLTHFKLTGVSEYLENLVARIDTLLLDILDITTFFHQFAFDTSQLVQFISRTPKFKILSEACVSVFEESILDHASTSTT